MKKIILLVCAIITTGAAQHLLAQAPDPMKAWQDFMTPGEPHKKMAKEVGAWEAEVSVWMDPTTPPTKTKATNVVTMTMNGLYQIGNFSTNMMGMPMVGQSTSGYDNAKKMYVSTWIDNMGSGIIKMTGNYDATGKILTLTGMQTDPVSGKDTETKEVIKWIDNNSYLMTMYGSGMDGKEMKFMEGTFKRK